MNKKHTFEITYEQINKLIEIEEYCCDENSDKPFIKLSTLSIENKNAFLNDLVNYYANPYDTSKFSKKCNGNQTYIYQRIQYIVDRYYQMFNKFLPEMEEKQREHDFIEWWINQPRANKSNDNTLICEYCGSSEKEYFEALTKARENMSSNKDPSLLISKKKCWNKCFMEIDEKIPRKGKEENYCKDTNFDNCVFACHLCNNAKSDLISYKHFKAIGKSIREFLLKAGE